VSSAILSRVVAAVWEPVTERVGKRPARDTAQGDDSVLPPGIRDAFVGVERVVPVSGGRARTYVNLDNAATTPAFRDVSDSVSEFLEWYGSVHRGTGAKSRVSSHWYERTREIVADFVGADLDYHTVILTCGTTGAVNKLARTISARGRPLVLCTFMEHHSNLLPWREHCRVVCADVRPDGSLDLDDLEAQLVRHHGEVRLVAVTGASNVTGLMPPIHSIARLAHEHGAEVFVDGAQLVPHRPVRMGVPGEPESLDYLAFSAHKMYAPFGTGALVGKAATFADATPEGVGGGTVNLVTPDKVLWAGVPAREEPGTPNVVGAVALAKSICMLQEIGMERVALHDSAMRRRIVRALDGIPGVRLFGEPAADDHDRLGVVSFLADGVSHGLLAAALGHEWGVAVRHGCFCAHPYIMRLLGIGESEMSEFLRQAGENDHSRFPGLVRVSVGLYNTPGEVDYLAEAVSSILREGPRARYAVDAPTGEYLPVDGQFDVEGCFDL